MWLLSLFNINSLIKAMAIILFVFLGVFVSPAFAGEQTAVIVKNAWVKLAPPGAKVNAAYMQFYNHSSVDNAVVAVSADCCKEVMVHQSRRIGDRIFMDHLDRLEIPARSELMLSPGGLHLMLTGAQAPLKMNDEVKIILTFTDGTILTVTAPVTGSANE